MKALFLFDFIFRSKPLGLAIPKGKAARIHLLMVVYQRICGFVVKAPHRSMKKHNAYAENQDSAQRLMKICQQDA